MGDKMILAPAHEAQQAIDGQDRLLRAPVASMTTEEVLVAWSILDHIEKVSKKRKELLREALLTEAETHGDMDPETGTSRLPMLGGKVTRQARTSVKLDAKAVEKLCVSEGIDLSNAGTFKFEPSDSKLAELVVSGQLTAEQVADASKVRTNFALLVDKPTVVKQMIEGGQDGKLVSVQQGILPEESS